MVSYLFDSDRVIALLKGVPAAIELFSALGPASVSISVITYAEVSEGLDVTSGSRQATGWWDFLAFAEVLPVDRSVADTFASLRKALRSTGNLIPDLDLLIGATALEHDLMLVTGNLRHFERIPDLRVYRG